MDKKTIKLEVNGNPVEREVDVRLTLADFLRHSLDLTGTHVGCEHGVCGACTVLIDGRSARSCLTFAVQIHGHCVTTIEGLGPAPGELGVLQQAFQEHHALQCGFCTPGMLTTLTELLSDTPDPTEEEIRDVITGNLCRCTGYSGIVAATLAAAQRLKSRGV